MDINQEPVSDAISTLDMTWSNCIFPLKDFIELYPLPQMVQVLITLGFLSPSSFVVQCILTIIIHFIDFTCKYLILRCLICKLVNISANGCF